MLRRIITAACECLVLQSTKRILLIFANGQAGATRYLLFARHEEGGTGRNEEQ